MDDEWLCFVKIAKLYLVNVLGMKVRLLFVSVCKLNTENH